MKKKDLQLKRKVPRGIFNLFKLDIDCSILIEQIVNETKQLAVLINNAAFMVTAIAEETPMDTARQ